MGEFDRALLVEFAFYISYHFQYLKGHQLKVFFFACLIFFSSSVLSGLTLDEAVNRASDNNAQVQKLKSEITELEEQGTLTNSTFSDKVFFQLNAQRDPEHFGIVYIDDLYQRNFPDYSFNQTTYGVTYQKTLFSDLRSSMIESNKLAIKNKLLLKDHLQEIIVGKVRLIFLRMFLLKTDDELLNEEKRKLQELQRIAESRFGSTELISTQMLLLNTQINWVNFKIYSSSQKNQKETNDLSVLVNEKIDPKEIFLPSYQNLSLENIGIGDEVKRAESLDEEIIKNKVKSNRLNLNIIEESNRGWDIQYGMKYFSGLSEFDSTFMNLENVSFNFDLNDNYGQNGFFKGLYGSDLENGILFFVNFKYYLFGNGLDEKIGAKEAENAKKIITYNLISQDNRVITENQKEDIDTVKFSIETRHKNISSLEKGLSDFIQGFKMGKVTIEEVIEYEDKLYEEKLGLNEDLYSLNQNIFSLYASLYKGLNSLMDEYDQ